MIGHITGGVRATNARTRVNTVLINTCFISRTLWVNHTFRLAFNVWIAYVIADARARCGCSAFRAFRVDAARAGVAGFDYFYWACS